MIAVVRGEAAPGFLGRLKVEETLRGDAKVGDLLAIPGREDREDLRIVPAARSVAFLRKSADGTWSVPAGALGLFPLDETVPGSAEDSTLALVRLLVEETAPGGALGAPGRVRAALVATVETGSARLRAGAAFDLLREPGILDGAPENERMALVRSFQSATNRSRARVHLAGVLARLRPEGAGRMLVDALVQPDGFALRSAVGEALGVLADPSAISYLASKGADPVVATRALVAGTLGWTGMAEARVPLEGMLGASEPVVRGEAVVSLGRLRLADAAPALLRRFLGAPAAAPGEPEVAPEGDAGVRRAMAWALAQCDAPDAWRALEGVVAAEGREDDAFRAFVKDTMANPRRGFVR